MLVLFLEDKNPGFIFLGLSMDRLPADIWSHLLTFADPRQMATRADELWTVRGRVNSVQALSPQDKKLLLLYPGDPEQDCPLVEPEVQVHLHPPPSPQSTGILTSGDMRPTRADYHVPSQETR